MEIEEEIRKIEEEISRTPYNKATQKHIGFLKAKLARLRERRAGKRSSGYGYGVRKSGDATVILVGFPSVGKSTILNRLTRAESRVGEYDFTTINVIPGMMEYNGARIQILDIPGVIEGVSSGKGRGREILSVVRNADLILIVAEPGNLDRIQEIRKELYNAGFRLDQKKPDVKIIKRCGGGIEIGSAVKLTKITRDVIQSVLREFRILNAEVVIRQDITLDQFIDSVMDNRVYVPSLTVINKIDTLEKDKLEKLQREYGDYIFISAEKRINMESLKEEIWKKLCLIRVYLKRIGKEPDMNEPIILKKGSAIKHVAEKIHSRVFGERLMYARIWGPSARFPGQKKGPDHILMDGDIVELHVR
ncbi:MAG TPA: GTP-binding protein [Candidatus Aenigmarchaeota archaeon]|nr:GTP-binding protein [Candidatus Aenigmarchaeota archaeon]